MRPTPPSRPRRHSSGRSTAPGGLRSTPATSPASWRSNLSQSLAAYNRAPLAVILAAIAEAAPTREALLRDANQRGERPPPLNVARLIAIAPGECRLH